MIARYPNFHRWFKEASSDPLVNFGRNNQARMRSTLNRLDDEQIRYEIEPLSDSFFDWFSPLYESKISSKRNAKLYDIKDTTLNKIDNPRPYYSLAVYENNVPVGGTIFSFLTNRLSIAYRVYENNWINTKLQANPSLYSEYLISKHAHDKNMPIISHGKDRNPYGLNSNIGLGLFKLSVGCYPLLPEKYEIIVNDTDTFNTDALIMCLPETGTKINQVLLVTDEPEKQIYSQLFKYNNLFNINVIGRKELS